MRWCWPSGVRGWGVGGAGRCRSRRRALRAAKPRATLALLVCTAALPTCCLGPHTPGRLPEPGRRGARPAVRACFAGRVAGTWARLGGPAARAQARRRGGGAAVGAGSSSAGRCRLLLHCHAAPGPAVTLLASHPPCPPLPRPACSGGDALRRARWHPGGGARHLCRPAGARLPARRAAGAGRALRRLPPRRHRVRGWAGASAGGCCPRCPAPSCPACPRQPIPGCLHRPGLPAPPRPAPAGTRWARAAPTCWRSTSATSSRSCSAGRSRHPAASPRATCAPPAPTGAAPWCWAASGSRASRELARCACCGCTPVRRVALPCPSLCRLPPLPTPAIAHACLRPPPPCSVRTFGRMRDEMVYAALRCRRPKWLVLAGLLVGKKWTEAELFYPPDQARLRSLGACISAAPVLCLAALGCPASALCLSAHSGFQAPLPCCSSRPAQLPMEAREALRAYQLSLERNASVRRFMTLAGDFAPPGAPPLALCPRLPGCLGSGTASAAALLRPRPPGSCWRPAHAARPPLPRAPPQAAAST